MAKGSVYGSERGMWRDVRSGLRIMRLTHGPCISTNLYFEFCSFSPDDAYVILLSQRQPHNRQGCLRASCSAAAICQPAQLQRQAGRERRSSEHRHGGGGAIRFGWRGDTFAVGDTIRKRSFRAVVPKQTLGTSYWEAGKSPSRRRGQAHFAPRTAQNEPVPFGF